jgi:single-stranded DNA-binding protein
VRRYVTEINGEVIELMSRPAGDHAAAQQPTAAQQQANAQQTAQQAAQAVQQLQQGAPVAQAADAQPGEDLPF